MTKDLLTEKCLWEKLQEEKRPIILYGTGNGADKILDVCEKFNIIVSGVFASSGFVRNRTFRGMPVESYETIIEKYGNDIVILLAFGTTLPDVIKRITEIARYHTLYIPEVPLYGTELFDRAYYTKHIKEIEDTENIFEDEESKLLYEEMIKFRLFGTPSLLHRVESSLEMYKELLNPLDIKTIIDCGAFKGDSTSELISALSPQKIYALEPDPKTFTKLSEYCGTVTDCNAIPLNYAVGDKDCETEFHSSGSRGSGIEGANHRGKTKIIATRKLDSIILEPIDLIKLDVEGNEKEAISGANELISRYQPSMSVSLYHRSEDIYELPLIIKELCPDHTFYLRRVPCIPAWDLSLVAVKTK